MGSRFATRRGSGPHARIQVLLPAALIAAVTAGLLAMHVLAPHVMPSGDSGAHAAVAEHGGAHLVGALDEGVVSASPVASVAPDAPMRVADMCASCGGDEAGMALACVFVLLIALLLRAPRRPFLGRAASPSASILAWAAHRTAPFRAPARHALCVMRT
ncbi:hypothetical protein [Microbacterium karelineae]|uniref:hypothetical protein n=1 Tax=Microbacterium karelineae TaxID=2654283 RepID=UPI0012EA484D|nr:hypothetical protein [Microbacterium karelineae]